MSVLLTALDRLADAFGTNAKIAVTFAAVGFLLIVLLSYRQLQDWISERTKPLYGDILSTGILIWTCLFTLSVVLGIWELTGQIHQIYAEELGHGIVVQGAVTFILVVGTLILTRFVKRILDEVLTSASAVTDHQREITHRTTQVIIWSMSIVVILGIWVDDLSSLLVGAGFFGIVVGMAARQTLGTMLSGFVLMFDRPFEIGDWIQVDDEEGIVTDISIVNTRLQSFDGEYIMIPNDVIASSMVTNRSKRGRLRVEVDVGVDYGSDAERASEIATNEVEALEESLTAPSPQVVTKEFDDSAVVLGVRFWIDNPSARRFSRARTAAIHAIKTAFEEEGIKIPYPQRELSGRAETSGFRVAEGERQAMAADGDTAGDEDTDDAGDDEADDGAQETNPSMTPSEDD